jgi:type IV pilus assembly protein PilX
VGRQDFWNFATSETPITAADASLGEVPLSAMIPVGARYGQFTGAAHKTDNGQLNPILAETADGKGGWYWIEVMRYSDAAKTANLITDSSTSQLPLNLDVYVITELQPWQKDQKMELLLYCRKLTLASAWKD